MPRFVRCPAASHYARRGFLATVLTPVRNEVILKSMTTSDQDAFRIIARKPATAIWAWKRSRAQKGAKVFEALKLGDLAFFYTDKRFRYYAPIIFKWHSDTLETLVPWTRARDGHYSLAFALGDLAACDLSSAEYLSLVNYNGMPVHSDIHDERVSDELFAYLALKPEFALSAVSTQPADELNEEGRIIYRIQCMRERSEGNRLKVFAARGYTCEVCGFNVRSVYGAEFKDTTHVHHLKPMALGTRRAQSLDEFAVLCSPCHTAAHMGPGRKLNPWSPQELREIIRSKQKPTRTS